MLYPGALRNSSFLLLLILILSCKKDNTSGLKLYDKPQSFIKRFISGKWEYKRGINGYSQQQVVFEPGLFLVFKFTEIDSVFLYRKDTLLESSTIRWSEINSFFSDTKKKLL